MPQAGTYTGKRIDSQSKLRDALSSVSLVASPVISFSVTLGPRESIQYILTLSEVATGFQYDDKTWNELLKKSFDFSTDTPFDGLYATYRANPNNGGNQALAIQAVSGGESASLTGNIGFSTSELAEFLGDPSKLVVIRYRLWIDAASGGHGARYFTSLNVVENPPDRFWDPAVWSGTTAYAGDLVEHAYYGDNLRFDTEGNTPQSLDLEFTVGNWANMVQGLNGDGYVYFDDLEIVVYESNTFAYDGSTWTRILQKQWSFDQDLGPFAGLNAVHRANPSNGGNMALALPVITGTKSEAGTANLGFTTSELAQFVDNEDAIVRIRYRLWCDDTNNGGGARYFTVNDVVEVPPDKYWVPATWSGANYSNGDLIDDVGYGNIRYYTNGYTISNLNLQFHTGDWWSQLQGITGDGYIYFDDLDVSVYLRN